MRIRFTSLAVLCACGLATFAQEEGPDKIKITGSVQSDILIPQEDEKIGTGTYDDFALTNTYADVQLRSKYVEAGARFEFTEYPLPGYEKDFKGWGVPYFYAKGRYKWAELTAGDFYDQFGSGLIFRTYEERSLGIDNALRGGRLVLIPFKGVRLKALGGKQRRYWKHNKAWVYGGDLELNLDQWIKPLSESGTYLTLGVSAVSKHEDDEDVLAIRPTGQKDQWGADIVGAYKLNLPRNVGAFDVRLNLQKGGFGLLAEYARKSHDPSFDNGLTYRHGNTVLLSTSYSKKGLSLLLQAKRSEDMSWRSRRMMTGTSSFVNHLPAFSFQHTYALAALYPYATQNTPGEWAFQGQFGYTFKRHTPLGGKYGTHIEVNASHIRGIETRQLYDENGMPLADLVGTRGFHTRFFNMGNETYYQDINVQLEKKLSKKFKLNLMYVNQRYNKTVVEGEGGTIKSDIFVAEGKYQFSKKLTLRAEAQYLHTEQDQKDWWFGLLELSVLPDFMFTISDQFNAHVPEGGKMGAPTHPVHYYNAMVTYTKGAHRLTVGYAKVRAGFNCSGGVCRWVPAQKGVQISYNFNF